MYVLYVYIDLYILCATTDHSENSSTQSCTDRKSSQLKKNNYFAET